MDPGRRTAEDEILGKEVDPPEFICSARHQLVLGPNENSEGHRVFIGAELDEPAWERVLRVALRSQYVVQERLCSASQKFAFSHDGELQMKEAEFSVHPYVFNGRMRGASALVRTCAPACTRF
jgi:hypothetical protein